MDGVGTLLAATTAFVGSHFLLSHPLRRPLVERIGETRFVLVYSAVAAATFGWFIVEAVGAPSGPLWWIAGPGLWELATLLMLMASILLAGSLVGNPATVDPTLKPRIPDEPRGVLAITRHPMMWSFTIWAAVHALLWGTPANLIVACGIGLLAFGGAQAQDAKKKRLLGAAWGAWQSRTSFWPFGAQVTRRATWRAALPGLATLLGGVAIWLVATGAHQWLGGPVAGPWRWFE